MTYILPGKHDLRNTYLYIYMYVYKDVYIKVTRNKYMKETRKTGCMDIYMARLRFSTYVHPIQM